MWRDEEGNRGGHLAGIRGENSCDSMGPGLQNAVSVKILPHPWQSFPVFGLPMDREREGCRGLNDAARLSRPALHDPPPQSHVDGVGRIDFLALHFLGFEWRQLYLEWSRSGGLPHRQAAPDKTTSSNAGWRGGCPGNTGFSNGPESLSRSQASSWHENSLLGEQKEREKGSGGKGLECEDSGPFSSGTRAGGALSEIAHRGFRTAQSLWGRGKDRDRSRARQIGLRQQSCVFPGA